MSIPTFIFCDYYKQSVKLCVPTETTIKIEKKHHIDLLWDIRYVFHRILPSVTNCFCNNKFNVLNIFTPIFLNYSNR